MLTEYAKALLFLAAATAILIWVLFFTPDPVQQARAVVEETPEERAYVEKRIQYHGLNGIIVLRESDRGWEFERQGQWCRL